VQSESEERTGPGIPCRPAAVEFRSAGSVAPDRHCRGTQRGRQMEIRGMWSGTGETPGVILASPLLDLATVMTGASSDQRSRAMEFAAQQKQSETHTSEHGSVETAPAVESIG
jgi:hypothetical protein